MLFTKPAQLVFEMDILESTDNTLNIDFHYCPLVKAWQKAGCTDEEIAALCGINKDVTFHVARHTFATTVTLENGVPVESVSKMLGHTNIQTTQIYARITERKINQDMDVLSKKLDPQTGVYIMPESEYRARKAKKLRKELQEFALANGVSIMNSEIFNFLY